MRISSIDEYGLRCLLSLARKGPRGQLSISEIAETEGLSVPYASKLLSILRKANLVVAERGRAGGFSLARDPGEIDLFEVITTLGGPIIDPDHCRKFTGVKDRCVHVGDCTVHDVLGGLAGYIRYFLQRTTLKDLISDTRLDVRKPDGGIIELSVVDSETSSPADNHNLETNRLKNKKVARHQTIVQGES